MRLVTARYIHFARVRIGDGPAAVALSRLRLAVRRATGGLRSVWFRPLNLAVRRPWRNLRRAGGPDQEPKGTERWRALAIAAVLLPTPSFAYTFCKCRRTVPCASDSVLAISAFDIPTRMSAFGLLEPDLPAGVASRLLPSPCFDTLGKGASLNVAEEGAEQGAGRLRGELDLV